MFSFNGRGGQQQSRGGGRGGGGGGDRFAGRSRGGPSTYRGRGGRTGGRHYDRQDTVGGNEEPSILSLCKFHTTSGSCNYGASCRNSHAIGLIGKKPAHEKPIKSLGMMKDGPRLLTGSVDCSIKVWNISTGEPVLETSLPANGSVQHIEVQDSTVMYSVDEPSLPVASGLPDLIPYGVVHLLNPASGATIVVKKGDELPYTHPWPIRAFLVATVGTDIYTITAGGEGSIALWKFDSSLLKFTHIMAMDGHLRGVTALVIQDACLWSCSLDTNIRVWDLNSGKCVATIGLATEANAHKSPVAALEVVTCADGEYVASGSADGELKLWRNNGEFAWSGFHSGIINCLRAFKDELGGDQMLLVGTSEGVICARSCVSMNIMFVLDRRTVSHQDTITNIVSLGHSCFASVSDDGHLMIWQVQLPLKDTSV